MERRLIGQWVKFEYNKWGARYWCVNSQYHRDDGGPSWEILRTGYCEWWEWDKFVRDNQCDKC